MWPSEAALSVLSGRTSATPVPSADSFQEAGLGLTQEVLGVGGRGSYTRLPSAGLPQRSALD